MLENLMVAQIQKFKNKVHLFFNFASGRTLPTQSTGPQALQVMARSPTSVSADSIDYVTWCKAPGNSFNLTGLPSSADQRRRI